MNKCPHQNVVLSREVCRNHQRRRITTLHLSCLLLLSSVSCVLGAADLILTGGKVVTVDGAFSIHQAVAVEGDRIARVGTDAEILSLKGPDTQTVDLAGKMVLPGLIDSHVHPGAAMTEFDHDIPTMESIADVLDYIRARTRALPAGEWIVVEQVFITRLRERRYPTRAELDQAAPEHPVVFRTGPDASLNSLALRLSGIDRHFKVTDGESGFVEMDPASGEPTGILRNGSRFIKSKPSGKHPTPADYERRTRALFADYNQIGITSVGDRSASIDSLDLYQRLRDQGQLTVRVFVSHNVPSVGPLADVQERIRAVARHPLCQSNDMLRIIGIKMFLDGGMLTGSAYMRQPWGLSSIYSITDPNYRGVLFIPKDRLLPMVRTTVESGLQFTAHSVGDGAVHTLLDVYQELAGEGPIRQTRPCITHCNFMSEEAVAMMARLGVVADLQPAWLYLDASTLLKQFGNERLAWFQPLHSLFASGVTVGGGSDHMQKIGSLRSINPYNPFLGMATAVSRQARWMEGRMHPEQALTRQQAIQFYTRNNAFLLFNEDRIGSIEPGKLADFIVVDRDLLTCPENDMRDTKVLRTYLGGRLIYQFPAGN